MLVLIDINHPAHAHFFHHPAKILSERGHRILVTSRDKECARALIDSMGFEHRRLKAQRRSGMVGMFLELIERDAELVRLVRQEKPDVLAALGGTFAAHAGFLTRRPSVVFYDTENAKLQNLITYPLASRVVVPDCYQAWTPRNTRRYRGYHELSYLHPRRFSPSRDIAVDNGLDPSAETFLVRVVSWDANHDIGETGWSETLLRDVAAKLAAKGKLLISAEGKLPRDLENFRYTGAPEKLHHVMAHARLFVGESATMASESAVLGVPAIYAANTGRGYTDEQESRYGLVRNLRELDWQSLDEAIDAFLAEPPAHWQQRQQQLLDESVDVAGMVADIIEARG